MIVRCCTLHGRNCEYPYELCCEHCTEIYHFRINHGGERCSSPDISRAGEIRDLCKRTRIRYRNERDVQLALADLFEAQGWEAAREAQLAPGERIDFLLDRIGIEVKIKGSTPHVLQQLDRYAATGLVDCLVLITSRAKHRELDGVTLQGMVPVCVAGLPWL